MSRSKNKNRSEVEYLRGKIRKLESQLKYYRKREHFFEAPVEEIIEEVEGIDTNQCDQCRRGVIVDYDFKFAILRKCTNCDFEERKKKN